MDEERKRPPDSLEEDAAWVRAFQKGDRAAFDRLVLKHKDNIFSLCYRFLGDYEEANDSAQETFIRAYRSLRGFRFESAFSTWLYRIGVNTCKNKMKSLAYRKRKVTFSLDSHAGSVEGNPGANIPVEGRSPAAELARKERMAIIQKAIDGLSEEQKEVVVLRDIQGLAYEEIGEITGLNPGTVKSRIARGRQELRRMLKDVI